ncbi:AP2 domain-containing protein [Pseudomonas nitroreducens]|uniref:AP2 domain-containing protein n=1 Tax=Pseudomonas nitroreducens TaxID=46680 RepID=UPI0024473187|nr:AP2 domain-containing protein [Pseudomonas nitroreducens]MDG9858223.1 AP2 domain-containing protein [Pseudomonas nitroreducens]
MKTIEASGGQQIIVDDDDFDSLEKFNWRIIGKGYAARNVAPENPSEGRIVAYMHREILGLQKGDSRVVDHVNGNPLDNRRCNLRVCTTSQNGMNRGPAAHNKSGFKGVFWDRRRSKWTAYIRVDGRQKYLGLFATPEMAHQAYSAAALEFHGAFARTE